MNWWLSWWNPPGEAFTLHSPWWISGHRLEEGEDSIVAAVRAETAPAAWAKVKAGYDNRDVAFEWRFIEVRPDDWSPFNGRFPKADWMDWAERTCLCGQDGCDG